MHLSALCHENLINVCADKVIRSCWQQLPLLHSVIILLPSEVHAPTMRQALLSAAKLPALIPPVITTLKGLFLIRNEQVDYLSEAHCQLILSAALHDNPQLLPHANCWKLGDALLNLFNEIDEQETIADKEQALTDETALLGSIYSRWHQETANISTEHRLYQQALKQNLLVRDNEKIFCCGLEQLSCAEENWVQRLQEAGQLVHIQYESSACTAVENDTALECAQLLDLIWGKTMQSPQKQIEAVRGATTQSPLQQRLAVFRPDDFEQHAIGIRTQITRWLSQGIQDIAVVTQDRKLSRRLRALLERKNINVHDRGGWALSTTSSAAALLLLIPPAETGFLPQTLINLIRSPYCRNGRATAVLQKCVNEIHRMLSTAPEVLETFNALQRFILSSHRTSPELHAITTLIKDASEKLQALQQKPQQRPFNSFFTALHDAMQMLGMDTSLHQDSAGERLLRELNTMQQIAEQENIKGNWQLWRSWVMHWLEKHNFTPPGPSRGISLYNFNQASLLSSEALIIAALDKRHMQPSGGTVLNDFSRRRLGIKTREFYATVLAARLQSLVKRAQKVLLTCQTSADGQTLTPAPWLEELQSFHKSVYAQSLEIRFAADTSVSATNTLIPQPGPVRQPQPQAPQDLWPGKISASAYHSAVSCPYQFFARYCLNIKSRKEPAVYDSQLEYGNHLHTCVAALHCDDPQLPGPMDKPWSEEHLNYAKKLAAAIVTKYFAAAASKHYTAAWRMLQAQAALEHYVEWIIKKKLVQETFCVEESLEKTLSPALDIYGRLDCIAENTDREKFVFDYKSGRLPTRKAINNGENVQIGLYSLLADDAAEVAYLGLTDTGVKELCYSGEDLYDLRNKHKKRLLEWLDDYYAGYSLPAWATEATCQYCDYSGICRRSIWNSPANAQSDPDRTLATPAACHK